MVNEAAITTREYAEKPGEYGNSEAMRQS